MSFECKSESFAIVQMARTCVIQETAQTKKENVDQVALYRFAKYLTRQEGSAGKLRGSEGWREKWRRVRVDKPNEIEVC
jgi:hypothetical protein